MPVTTKKPIKIVPNTIKTIPKIAPATIIPKKTLEEQLEEIYDDIDVNVDDLPDELLEVYEELEGEYKEKSIQKNWKLWLTMFTPFILPAFIKGVSGQVTLPYDARQSVQSNAPEPKVVVDYAKKYFEEHGLELAKTLSQTDCERLKVQLRDNWGKGPTEFKKSFEEDYTNTKARLDAIYRTEYVTAQNEGILARSRDAGHKMKQWNAALDERTCPVCGDQLHGTIIPIEEEFTAVVEHKNGSEEISVNGPPAHVNCRCVLTTLDEDDYDEIKEDSAYIFDAFETIKLNYNCPDSEKNGTGPGSCGGSSDSKIDRNPEIAPADYNSFFENFNKISKDKSEPDRVMRRLNAETVQRRFYRKTEEHFNEIKPENDKKLKENGEKLWDNLRPEVQSAIKSYTTQDYGVINSALQDDITREEVLLLKEATSKPLGVRTILYRGINFKMPKDIFKVGATWIHKPFASCSTGSFIAEEAASGKLTHITPEEKTILQIFTEPETKGFAVGKNSFHAGADAGSEVILDAGTKFQTIHSEKRGGMRILTVRAINDKQKQDSSYLEDVTNFIKLNYKCPKGTVDDSNKCDIEKPIVNIPIPNKFKDIDNVKSDKIRGESSEFLNQLVQNNEYLVNSLKSYTNIGHLEVNKYLGNRISGNIPKETEKIIIGLDSIFNLQKEQNFLTSSSITTYRGVSDIEIENLLGLNQKHIYDIEPGKIITDPKFVSTTLNKEQALQFGRDRYGGSIITILIPKNSEALHTESVSGSEDELLINRNQSYKFLGVNKNIDNSGLDSNKPVHEFIFELVNANQKQSSSHLSDAVETIKLNYNCPDDEKIGSGPGSCSGGNTSNLDKVSTLKNKIRELEKSVSEGKSTFDEAYEQYKSIQKELDLELEKEKLRNPDNAKITNNIVTDPEPITPYKALSDYQNYAYTAINDYLRKTNYVKQNPQQTKNIQNMIKTIDSEMENNTLKSDKLVFRADSAGISSDAFEKTGLTNIFKDTFGKESLTLEDFIKNYKLIDKIREKLVGYEYTEKAYLSTGSDKENTMNRFLAPSRDISKYGVTGLINLIVPKGTPAIRIADYTGLEDELGGKIDEYLIGRDQTIVIDQVYIRPADDDRLYLEYNAHIKTNEQKQNSEYLEDVTNFIKLNYNCPDSEKIGSGPGSCGGSKPDAKKEALEEYEKRYHENQKKLDLETDQEYSKIKNSMMNKCESIEKGSIGFTSIDNGLQILKKSDNEYVLYSEYGRDYSKGFPGNPSSMQEIKETIDRVMFHRIKAKLEKLDKIAYAKEHTRPSNTLPPNSEEEKLLLDNSIQLIENQLESVDTDLSKYFSRSFDVTSMLVQNPKYKFTWKDPMNINSNEKENIIATMDKLISQSTINSPITTYSGISKEYYDKITKNPNKPFKSITFMSTSRDESIAEGFAEESRKMANNEYLNVQGKNMKPVGDEKYVAEVHLVPGSKAISLEKYYDKHYPYLVFNYAGENRPIAESREIVVNRGTKYKVIGTKKFGNINKVILESVVD